MANRGWHWTNLGNKTVESTCLEERKDVAITFAIPHRRDEKDLHQLEIKIFKNEKCVDWLTITGLTYSEAKAWVLNNIELIMENARTFTEPGRPNAFVLGRRTT